MADVRDLDPDDLTICVMDRMALDQAMEWAAAEGWNPGLNDADCFHTADPTGYGVIWTCRSGHKIGLLFANSECEADMLFQALAARARGASVFLDLADPNQAAVQLAVRTSLLPVFETALMYCGVRPDLPPAQTYGISTIELG